MLVVSAPHFLACGITSRRSWSSAAKSAVEDWLAMVLSWAIDLMRPVSSGLCCVIGGVAAKMQIRHNPSWAARNAAARADQTNSGIPAILLAPHPAGFRPDMFASAGARILVSCLARG